MAIPCGTIANDQAQESQRKPTLGPLHNAFANGPSLYPMPSVELHASAIAMATLLYGKSLLQASFPEDTDVIIIEKKAMIPLDDGVAAINDAVRQPVGTELTLHSSAEGADSACILICDITRWVSSL